MIITASNLEFQAWEAQTGPDINPVPADSFAATLIPGNILKVVNQSSKPLGGALVTCKPAQLTLVNIAALPYSGLDAEVYVSAADMAKLGRLELDVKRCITPGKVGNFSSQLNQSNGAWQIDGNPPGWKDTGFFPLLPSVWTKLKFRHYMDADGFSFQSVKWGGSLFEIPATMQNVPLLDSATWANVFAIQIQTEILQPGSVTINLRNVTAYLSDEAIP